MELHGKALEDFNKWYFKNWGAYIDSNFTRLWMQDDVFKCYSLFFGCKIRTVNKLKFTVEQYNKEK